ncbi:serine/threonine protein kinase [Rubrivivax sp. RP6-9]|uniref:serine/threonine protein kinase n=1 Tax=Rubrivivax sp. RP6-9 TaxID=3415750 RepID=UPI003CC50969
MSDDTSRPRDALPSALPIGTRLGEFEVLRVLGVGGFGIVYLAVDHALEREVAVKEYMPAALAGRTETLHVSLRSQGDADTFALGLKSFVNEARLLARFDHPSLLKVHRFWEANGTAYMAMPVYRGRTLKEVRAEMAAPPDEAWLRALLLPLLGAIEKLHGEGVFHRDIAPDNIIVEADGHPVLLDFGAARRVISDKSQTLTAILKPAYAPIEQYAEAGSVKQGPWTDLYALGATLHYMLLGRPPAPATARAVQDDHTPLAGQLLPGCSDGFLRLVDWMLAPRPADRPQHVAAVRAVLDGMAEAPVRAVAAPPAGGWERTQVMEPAGPAPVTAGPAVPRTAAPAPADDATVIRPPARAATVPPPRPAPPPPVPPPAPAARAAAPAPTAPSRRMPLLLGSAGLAVAVVAAALLWPRTAPAPEAAAPAASVPAATVAVPAALPASVPAAETVAAPAPLPTPASATPAPAGAERPTPAPARPVVRPAPVARQPAEAAPAPVPAAEVVAPPPVRTAPVPAAAAPASAPADKPAAPPVLVGPTERCGSRILLALWNCIERECKKPELRQHPECVKWRAEQEQKANPTR